MDKRKQTTSKASTSKRGRYTAHGPGGGRGGGGRGGGGGATSANGSRPVDDEPMDVGSQFEDELAAFDDHSQEEDVDLVTGQGPALERTKDLWSRRPLQRPVEPGSDDISFQKMDIDVYSGVNVMKNSSSPSEKQPSSIIRLFGVTEQGHSVLTHVHGFYPYLFVRCPRNCSTEEDCEKFSSRLSQLLFADNGKLSKDYEKPVVSVEIVG